MLEAKSALANELQNEMNILSILLKQEQQENQRRESEITQSRNREQELQDMVRTLELQVKDVTARYDEFSREFDKAESKITEMSSKLKKVKNEKENAEVKVER